MGEPGRLLVTANLLPGTQHQGLLQQHLHKQFVAVCHRLPGASPDNGVALAKLLR